MGITSTDLALTTSRIGCARLGAARLGFIPGDVDATGVYDWREIKPPTTIWRLITEGCVCGKRPIALFSFVDQGGGLVQFTNETIGGRAPLTYLWDFGDGVGTSTEENPSYTYVGSGTFTATLTVVDAQLLDDDVSHEVPIVLGPSIIIVTPTWFYDYIPTGEGGAEAGYSGWDGGAPPGDYLDTNADHDAFLAALIETLTGLATGASVLLVTSGDKFNSQFQAGLTRLGHTFEITGVDFEFGAFDPTNFDMVCIDTHIDHNLLDAYIDAGGKVLGFLGSWWRYGLNRTDPWTYQTYAPEPVTRSVTYPPGGPYNYIVWSNSDILDSDIVTDKTRPGTTVLYQNDLGENALATWTP